MTKTFLVLFGLLTAVAIYATAMDMGIYNQALIKHSVRDGSARHERKHHAK